MTLTSVIQTLWGDTQHSLANFRPELVLCGTIVLVLLARMLPGLRRINSFYVALAGTAAALWLAAPWAQWGRGEAVEIGRTEIFTGLLVVDSFTVYFRVVLLAFAALFALFTRVSGVPDRDAATDFFPLVLGATLGMCLMASANHLLIVFLGVEMASVPSYVLAGMLKGRRQSSEAALKYAVYGAGAAGVMLYGISLLAGVLGTAHLPTLAAELAQLLANGAGQGTIMVLVLGGLMTAVGLAFKLSAVPFHFWCPDVFEGATAEVNAFLSVASKAGALALLVRVCLGLGYVPTADAPPQVVASQWNVSEPAAAPAAVEPGQNVSPDFGELTALIQPDIPGAAARAALFNAELAPVRDFSAKLLAFLAVITCTFGNLAAYGQTNIKRLLAYSTIAHAGYMMMPVAAALVLAGSDPGGAQQALGALAFYVGIYLFMNLGAFAVVAFLRNQLGSEQIADYAGLVRRAPVVVVCMTLLMVSLIGLPPLAGFSAKFLVFAALYDAGLITVLVIAGLNTAISLYYYLRVVKVMTMDPEPADRLPVTMPFIPATLVAMLTVPVLLLGVWWNGLNRFVQAVAAELLT
jgi:NADH-quinone oxidoreductase subunit N